ncbi:MAG: TrkH family potassium uptake protein [Anaerovoracaceae bacterium]
MDLNSREIIRIIGVIFQVMGAALTLPLAVGFIYHEIPSIQAFAVVLLPSILIGGIIRQIAPPSNKPLKVRDGVLIVSISWIIAAIIGSIPFILSGAIPNPIDAIFETCSGFSTTGASILSDIESLPKSILFWRSFTHWLGGMGILVFAVALLPTLGISGQMIVMAETPGPELSKLTPRISDTARQLYIMYFSFTIIETILLMLGGMNFYDALTHTFSTVGTGGFSTYNNSIAHFDSAYIEGVITVFMLLSGVNFNLYFILLRNGFKAFIKDGELKFYLCIVALTMVLITIGLVGSGNISDPFEAFRYASFQQASIITTTGFMSYDYALWPTFCQMILFLLFFVGGCSSSTGGGIKVIRVLVVFKLIKRSVALRLHPNAVVNVKINNNVLPRATVANVSNFIFLYLGILLFGGFIISLDGYNMITSLSATASCLGNIGPGFDAIGPTVNYSIFSDLTKSMLSLLMIAGRLELFTLFMLFAPRFWNPNK